MLVCSEYLITKYGNGKAVPPESGFIDNLYCEIRKYHIRINTTPTHMHVPTPVFHYAEGTLAPLFVQREIFDYHVLKNAPIVKSAFVQLIERLVNPEMKRNLAMVCRGYLFLIEGIFDFNCCLGFLD
jgi:glutathione S-transferase